MPAITVKKNRNVISLSIYLRDPIEWEGYKINIIDTPGYFDFIRKWKRQSVPQEQPS